ncbi:uncharacterized protein [Dermacentor albipictus]|uniref:uncharacterized protein isoform X1 n=2 Tax=Dermacentor albipictus TaxID=60249 RepID=UPI0031FDE74B
MTRISVSNLFFGCVVVSFDMRSRVDIGRYDTLVPYVPPKPRSGLAYTFTYMQWQALPCVPKTMPTPSHSSSLIQTPQTKRPWRQMQAASTPQTATLTAGVSP